MKGCQTGAKKNIKNQEAGQTNLQKKHQQTRCQVVLNGFFVLSFSLAEDPSEGPGSRDSLVGYQSLGVASRVGCAAFLGLLGLGFLGLCALVLWGKSDDIPIFWDFFSWAKLMKPIIRANTKHMS